MKSKVNPQKHSRNGSKFALKPCLKTFALSFCYQDFTTGKRFPTMKSPGVQKTLRDEFGYSDRRKYAS